MLRHLASGQWEVIQPHAGRITEHSSVKNYRYRREECLVKVLYQLPGITHLIKVFPNYKSPIQKSSTPEFVLSAQSRVGDSVYIWQFIFMNDLNRILVPV